MCRMTIYKGLSLEQSILLCDLIVKPAHSIIHQSYNCQERFHNTGLPSSLNADGFGIGWYAEKLYFLKEQQKDSSQGQNTSTNPSDCLSPSRKKSKILNPSAVCSLSSPRQATKPPTATISRDKQYETPCVFNSISPAWNNRNLTQLADKVSSPLFFAHVRAASIGSPTTEANCHPFTFDKYLWMHNGGIGDFGDIKRRLVNSLSDVAFNMINGSTDSEHCFALFLTKLAEIGPLEEEFSASNIRQAVIATIHSINEFCRDAGVTTPSLLNFAVTDGETVVATRYVNVSSSGAASLYFSSGSRWVESEERPDEYIMQRENKVEKVFIMASERLSNEVGDWIEIPKNSIVTVTGEMSIQICPIDDVIS